MISPLRPAGCRRPRRLTHRICPYAFFWTKALDSCSLSAPCAKHNLCAQSQSLLDVQPAQTSDKPEMDQSRRSTALNGNIKCWKGNPNRPCFPAKNQFFRRVQRAKMIKLLFPLRNPTKLDSLIFGSISTSMCV